MSTGKIEEKIIKIFESTPVALIMVDKDGHIVLVNQQTENIFKYSRDELLGKEIEILIPVRFRAHHPTLRNMFFQSPEKRDMGAGRDLYGLDKNGHEFPITIGLNPLQAEEGMFVVVSIIDITERKLSEQKYRDVMELIAETEKKKVEELTKANAIAEETVNDLQAFTYSVSHDLRSPLRAIVGFSNILLEDYADKLDEEGRRLLGVISQNASKMGQLIDDLLSFSRLGRSEIKKIEIDMSKLVNETYEELIQNIASEGVNININLLPNAFGDKAMIKQVFINLISNSIKYAKKGFPVSIEVGCTKENSKNIYYIKDNGIGFDMQYKDKLFGVFQRLHSGGDYEGTGVGLAIVKRIINKHGGNIWADSKLNYGATFYFVL